MAAYKKNESKKKLLLKEPSCKIVHTSPQPKTLKFCTDFDNSLVSNCFKNRGWKLVTPEENWNIYWSNTTNCRNLFNMDNFYRLNDSQLISHFPNHYELVRKDLLVKNIKKYRKCLEKDNNPLAAKSDVYLPSGQFVTRYTYLDFIPETFTLPTDYNAFIGEYQRSPNTTWILKPCGKSQGEGICLINKLSKLKKLSLESKSQFQHAFTGGRDSYVISRYIDNPLLIGGKKFDLRIYVLVTSFRPLRAYMFQDGFCRFCTMKYDVSVAELDNMLVHLTNVSVQKRGEYYNSMHGGKLALKNLMLHLEGTRGHDATSKLHEQIQWLIIHSLKAVAPIMTNDRHCFECYGYDIIIDDQLKPWLIEVNASPSLIATTINDRILKSRLLDNVLSVILPPDGIPDAHWNKDPSEEALGNFSVLICEELSYSSPKKNET